MTSAPRRPRTFTAEQIAARELHLAERRERRRRELDEDLAWVAGTDSWESIARRFGRPSAAALEKAVRRLGLIEWANRIERESINTSPDREVRHPLPYQYRAANRSGSARAA